MTDFVFLEDDFRKLAFLQRDRWLELHAQGGRHHRVGLSAARRLSSRAASQFVRLGSVLFVVCSSEFPEKALR